MTEIAQTGNFQCQIFHLSSLYQALARIQKAGCSRLLTRRGSGALTCQHHARDPKGFPHLWKTYMQIPQNKRLFGALCRIKKLFGALCKIGQHLAAWDVSPIHSLASNWGTQSLMRSSALELPVPISSPLKVRISSRSSPNSCWYQVLPCFEIQKITKKMSSTKK